MKSSFGFSRLLDFSGGGMGQLPLIRFFIDIIHARDVLNFSNSQEDSSKEYLDCKTTGLGNIK